MGSEAGGSVRVGRFSIPQEKATRWVSRYTDADANTTSPEPYAYPAYDRYNADGNSPAVLEDGDFLAPGLLNAPIGIRSFYALQRRRDELQIHLEHSDLACQLADLPDDRIVALIGGLYSVLDGPEADLWGVSGTTLSKVLHRKRPASIPLHDKWVRECYVGEGAPVPRAKSRSWAGYMSLVTLAMAKDIREQPTQFSILQRASRADPDLSDLRLLDILAWNAGQRTDDHRDDEPTNPAE